MTRAEIQKRKKVGVWRRLERVDPYRPAIFAWFTFMPLGSILAYELPAYGFLNPQIWIAGGISQLVWMGLYGILMLPFVLIKPLRSSAVGKLVVVITAYVIRSLVLVAFAQDFSDVWIEYFVRRVPGDASLIALNWIVIAVVTTMESEARAVDEEVQKVTDQLNEQKQLTASAAKRANSKLRNLAIGTLGDELDKMLHNIKKASQERDLWRLGTEIKRLVEGRVRPLSKEIMSRVDLLSQREIQQSGLTISGNLRNFRFMPRKDTRFWTGYWFGSVNVFATVFQLGDWRAAITVQVAALSLPLLGCLLIRFFPKRTRLKVHWPLIFFPIIVGIAYLPTGYVIHLWTVEHAALTRVQLTAYFVYLPAVMAVSFWNTYQRTREERIEEISKSQTELRRELALMDQAIWVAQRKWAYLIHGSVQSSLTVASSRLMYANQIDDATIRQVVKDVEKAKRSLQEAADFKLSSKQLISELTKSWAGICEVKFEVADEVHQRLEQAEGARTCFNEVCKELVSNAFRHGKARVIWISATLSNENDLLIISSNDGEPVPEDYAAGLGFSMFDELTSEWAFQAGPSQNFVAKIPIS